MLIEGWQVGFSCGPCKKIIQKLKDMVGDDPSDVSPEGLCVRVCMSLCVVSPRVGPTVISRDGEIVHWGGHCPCIWSPRI